MFASLAVLSLILAVALCVLWWRASHGHGQTVLHLGANSPNQTTIYTVPALYSAAPSMALRVQQTGPGGAINDRVTPLPFRQVLGGCFVVPALWAAILLRRRIRPRPPGSELPAIGRR